MELIALLNTLCTGRIFCGAGTEHSPFEIARELSPRPCDFRRVVAATEVLLSLQTPTGSQRFESQGRIYELRVVRIHDKTIVCLQDEGCGEEAPNFECLSKRETEVLDHLVQGLSNKQTAAALYLSPRTVEKHRANILRKMGTHSLAILTRMWLDHCDPQERAAA